MPYNVGGLHAAGASCVHPTSEHGPGDDLAQRSHAHPPAPLHPAYRSEPDPSAATADTVADSCDAMAATQPASISSDSDTWTMQYWMWCADAAAALGKPRTYAACV